MKQNRPIAIGYVADAIDRAHASTSKVTLVLENMVRCLVFGLTSNIH